MGGINSNVVLIIKGDGADQASIIYEHQYGQQWGFTGIQTRTASANKLFGQAAIHFSAANAAQKIIASAPHGFSFGTDPWTIDFFAKLNTSLNDGSYGFVFNYTRVGDSFCRWLYFGGVSGAGIVFNFRNVVNSIVSFFNTSGASVNISYGSFFHAAVTRYSTDIIMFIGGRKVCSQPINTGTSFAINAAASIYFGVHGPWSIHYFNGQIEEFRITKGVAVWTEDFTPPTEPCTWDIPVTNISLTVPNVQPKIAVPVGFTLANGFKRDIALKRVDMGVDQIRAALMSAGFLFNPLTHHDLSIANLSVNAIGNSILISVDTTLDNISDLVSIYFSGLSFLASTDNSVEGILLYNTTASYVIGFLSYQTTIPTNEIISCKGVYIRVE